MYAKGQGVEQNFAEAIRWFRRAAEQGLAMAQANLGTMYASGQGVKQNLVLAYMWLSLAANQDDKEAAELRDQVAPRMTPVQIAEAQKLAREWKPKK